MLYPWVDGGRPERDRRVPYPINNKIRDKEWCLQADIEAGDDALFLRDRVLFLIEGSVHP